MDEVFGQERLVNEIVWAYKDIGAKAVPYFKRKHDVILFYSKTSERVFNVQRQMLSESTLQRYGSYFDEAGHITYQWLKDNNPGVFRKLKGHPDDLNEVWLDRNAGQPLSDWWEDISPLKSHFDEALDYPTQKPKALLDRIIKASSNPGDLVFDCFMGSGTTQAVAMKLGRRFIGADINLGAIQTTTKRLINVAAELNKELPDPEHPKYTGFSVYNVNNYDVFRNPIEAKDILVQALEIEPLPGNTVYDGMDDDWYVKIMPVNRIATREDLNEIEANFPIKEAEKFKEEHPNKVFQKIRLVCMGHEPALDAELKKMIPYNIEVEILDILRDKSDLRFKRDAEAKIKRTKTKLTIEKFYPMNLMEKLSMQKEKVTDWREMVESVMIDFNYDGSVFTPTVTDIPEKDEFVKGVYDIPEGAGTIRVKITDLLSESLEQEVK